jgi:hypothetical protein
MTREDKERVGAALIQVSEQALASAKRVGTASDGSEIFQFGTWRHMDGETGEWTSGEGAG